MLQNKLCAVLWTSILIMGLTACGSGSVQVSSSGAQLTGISVTPTNPTIATNTSQPFTAIGIYSDNTTQDLTNAVTWSSSDTTVATVSEPALSSAKSNNGKAYAYGRNAGTTTITATSGSTSGSTTLTVTPATLVSLTVTPANPSIAAGSTRQFVATGTFSDSTTQDLTAQVTWNSSNTGFATIGTSGLAAGIAAGTTMITATSGSTSGSTTLTVTATTLVSLTVTPANPSIAAGSTRQFVATGTFSDSTTQDLTAQVTWNSSNAGVATISTSGFATGVAAGTVTITAASGSISGTATLTVTAVTTTGSATLSWAAPATNTDGTPLTDLAGYKVYYGTSSGNYTTAINVGSVLSYTVNNLPSGHIYYFAVTAYDSAGLESGYSTEASKTM